MKKHIIAAIMTFSIVISIIIISCPTNIEADNYGIYTIKGIVKYDNQPIPNILIEVKNQLVKTEQNVIAAVPQKSEMHNILRSEDIINSSSDDDSSSSNVSDSSSSETNDTGDSSSGDDSSSDSDSSSGESNNDKKPTIDDNPILSSCRTDDDGTFTLTIKAYASSTNEIFVLFVSDDDGMDNTTQFQSQTVSVDFRNIASQDTNPFGSYNNIKKTIDAVEITLKS